MGNIQNSKYEIIKPGIEYNDRILYRIRAKKDFGYVCAGNLGGWIENEYNLDEDGWCWIFKEAKVFGNARVIGNALVYDRALVYGEAKIMDDSLVEDEAKVFGNAKVMGHANIKGYSSVYDNAIISGEAQVLDHAQVFNDAKITDYAKIHDHTTIAGSAFVGGRAKIYDNAKIYGNARVEDNVEIYDDAEVYENAKVYDSAYIFGNAKIYGNSQVFDEACVYGYSRVKGNAEVYNEQRIVFGIVDHDIRKYKDWKSAIYHLFGTYPVNRKIILYIPVNKDFSMVNNSTIILKPDQLINAKEYGQSYISFSYEYDIRVYPDLPDEQFDEIYYKYFIVAVEIDISDIVDISSDSVWAKKARVIDVVGPIRK